MNEMLRGLGFDQVTNNKWTNGSNMMINVDPTNLDMRCYADIYRDDLYVMSMKFYITSTNLEDMKGSVEKFMRMVGKCIQVDENYKY